MINFPVWMEKLGKDGIDRSFLLLEGNQAIAQVSSDKG
jgi:hypothetical protein